MRDEGHRRPKSSQVMDCKQTKLLMQKGLFFFEGFAAKYLNHFDLLIQSRYIFLLIFCVWPERVAGSDTENQPRGLILC